MQAGAEPARQIYQTQALTLANKWYKYGNRENRKKLEETTVAFQSGLITGTGWDVMCNFIGWDECNTDSKNRGNYMDVESIAYKEFHSSDCRTDWELGDTTAKGTGDGYRWIFPTGKFIHVGNIEPTTSKKNIFDVAGNVWEWTAEITVRNYTEDSYNDIIRGGGAGMLQASYFATMREGHCSATTYAAWDLGFRLVLYVQ